MVPLPACSLLLVQGRTDTLESFDIFSKRTGSFGLGNNMKSEDLNIYGAFLIIQTLSLGNGKRVNDVRHRLPFIVSTPTSHF